MSDPTRYRVADNQAQLTLGGGVLVVDPAGPIVAYGAYAELKAENDRLRKAGDRLVFALEAMDIVMDMDSDHPEDAEWNAAKEGQP